MKASVALVALVLCGATHAKSGAQAASAVAGRESSPLATTTSAPSIDIRSDRARAKGSPGPTSGDAEFTTKDPYATPLFRMARPLK